MATIDYSISKTSNHEVWIVEWESLAGATSDVGAALSVASVPGAGGGDRSVQFDGTFSGTTIVLQGSNDGTNWFTLADPQGNAISKSSAALEAVLEYVAYVRPSVSGGTGSLNCRLVVKGSH